MTSTQTDGEADYFCMTADTVQQVEEMLSGLWDRAWIWTPPKQPPYTPPKPRTVTPPHLSATQTFPHFRGHKFRLGGSKK